MKSDNQPEGQSIGWSPIMKEEPINKKWAYIKICDWTGGTGKKPLINLYMGKLGTVKYKKHAVKVPRQPKFSQSFDEFMSKQKAIL